MEQKNKDFLLFYDWYLIIKEMSPKNAKMLLVAMVELQANDIEPPEFPNKIKDVASLMFRQIRRRKKSQISGKKGGEARAKAYYARKNNDETASSPLDIDLDDFLQGYRQDKTKTRQKQDSFSPPYGRNGRAGAREGAYAQRERKRHCGEGGSVGKEGNGGSAERGASCRSGTFDTDEFFEAAVKRSLGEN